MIPTPNNLDDVQGKIPNQNDHKMTIDFEINFATPKNVRGIECSQV